MKSMVVYYEDPETGVWKMGWGAGFPTAASPGLLALINKIIYTIKTQKGSDPSNPNRGCQLENILKLAPGLDSTEVSSLINSAIEDVAYQIMSNPISSSPEVRLKNLIVQSIRQDQVDKTVYQVELLVITESGIRETLLV